MIIYLLDFSFITSFQCIKLSHIATTNPRQTYIKNTEKEADRELACRKIPVATSINKTKQKVQSFALCLDYNLQLVLLGAPYKKHKVLADIAFKIMKTFFVLEKF